MNEEEEEQTIALEDEIVDLKEASEEDQVTAFALEDEIRELKSTLTRYRHTLLYVSVMVTVALIVEIFSYV